MSNLMLFVLMFFSGIMVAAQPSINARLAQRIGLLEAASVSFAVGTVALLLASLVVGRGNWKGAGGVIWWEWTGGFLGAFFVAAAIFAIPRIGTAATMAAVIAAQLLTGLVMDHYGMFGFRGAPIDAWRVIGIICLLLGAVLVFRR